MRSTSLPRHVVPGISLPANAHETVLFAPKCLVLISKFDYPEVFKNCLGVLYTAYRYGNIFELLWLMMMTFETHSFSCSECLVGAGAERIRLETLIGNLLGSGSVPEDLGCQLRFSLGASDKHVLHSLIHPSIPSTGSR